MIIWAIALVLFACSAFAGYCFGLIRAGFTFVGLLVALMLAGLGHHLSPLLNSIGVKNPFAAWILGPVILFVIVLLIFKIAGFLVQRKVDLYYKYQAGDLQMGLWNRLNVRLGLVLGLVNASIYLVLISLVIYVPSYATTQVAARDNTGWKVGLLNTAGRQLQSCGLAKVAAAIDPMPASYYQAADLAGLIYHNDLLEARLAQYPAFFSMGQRPEFQQIGSDKDFTELRQRQPPIAEILHHPRMQVIMNNPDLLREIWGIVIPNMQDLVAFLRTGHSQKYDGERILGHWDFDMNAALYLLRDLNPNITSLEMRRDRTMMLAMFTRTTMVATPEKAVFIKNLGKVRMVPVAANPRQPAPINPPRGGRGGPGGRPPAAAPIPAAPAMTMQVNMQDLQGQWSALDTNYQISVPSLGSSDAKVEGEKLIIKGFDYPMVFEREF